MDAKDQVRTQDREPRAKDQPHDLFDDYTNTKNALALDRSSHFAKIPLLAIHREADVAFVMRGAGAPISREGSAPGFGRNF